jgi:hypothetical protein
VAHTKSLLYYFENKSDIKINYHKIKVIAVGASRKKKWQVCRDLNCKEGKLVIKYLGMSDNDNKLYVVDLLYSLSPTKSDALRFKSCPVKSAILAGPTTSYT